jgi:hypothetical protein
VKLRNVRRRQAYRYAMRMPYGYTIPEAVYRQWIDYDVRRSLRALMKFARQALRAAGFCCTDPFENWDTEANHVTVVDPDIPGPFELILKREK